MVVDVERSAYRNGELRMPGTFTTIYLVAFDLDDHGQAVRAFEPRVASSEAAAIEEAEGLAQQHAGVVVWRRDNNPVVGEEGEPEVVFTVGRVGDFD